VNALRELAWTNSAAEVAEGVTKAQSSITFEQYNVPITTVAHWLKISNQLLADAPAVVAYIDSRLRDGLEQKIDAQLIIGNGTAPALSGFTDAGNFTAFTPTTGATLADSINKAKYQMWAAGYVPDTVIVNPADWGTLERLREGAGTGMYLYGTPGTPASMNPFGVQVVLSANLPVGNMLITAMRSCATLFERQSSTVELGYAGSDFTDNLITMRAEQRLGLGCDRPGGIWYGAWTI
jgi:HK97 family phage major capsid protein